MPNMHDQPDVSIQLKEILAASGFTQDKLAKRLGVSLVTCNMWLNGRSTPRNTAKERIGALYIAIVGGSPLSKNALRLLMKRAQQCTFNLRSFAKDTDMLNRLSVAMTYNTDAIEGSTMTLVDTESVLLRGAVVKNRSFIEQLEARNHQAALHWLIEQLLQRTRKIDAAFICELHARLMNGILSNAGYFRQHPIRIAHANVVTANYRHIPNRLDAWCESLLQDTSEPMTTLAESHAAFEQIHPFTDGNGRTGRLLLFAAAAQQRLVPPIIQRERRAFYYNALEVAQTNRDYAALTQLLCESMLYCAADVLKQHNNSAMPSK